MGAMAENPRIEDFIEESSVIDELSDHKNRLILVMGGSDTGKTTMVECFADFLSRKKNTGIVDLDMGQSHIGPPTTIAWGKVTDGFSHWKEVGVEDFYFTGTVTPFGSLLPAVVGAKLMAEKALSSCKKVIVDTTGLIAEPAGRVLKQFKIDILSPDIIIGLERSGELGHILDAFMSDKHPKVFRLPVPPQVKTKAIVRRSQYRFEKIKGYFAHSKTLIVHLEDVGLRFTREPRRETSGFGLTGLKHRIVSFRDENNRDIALGFIEGVRTREKTLLIRTPLDGDKRFSALVIGKTELDMANSLVRDRS